MVHIYVSDVIDAPIQRVWGLMRDFNGMPGYHPLIRDSRIEGGKAGDAVGCIRNFHFVNGGNVRETLLTLSDRDYECIYRIVEAPMPVSNYVSGYRLRAVTEGDRTFVEWWADYEVELSSHESVYNQLKDDVFRGAFKAITVQLRSQQ